MTPHYCPVEKTNISFDDECNWCGMKEVHIVHISNKLAWVTWAFVLLVTTSWVVLISFLISKYI